MGDRRSPYGTGRAYRAEKLAVSIVPADLITACPGSHGVQQYAVIRGGRRGRALNQRQCVSSDPSTRRIEGRRHQRVLADKQDLPCTGAQRGRREHPRGHVRQDSPLLRAIERVDKDAAVFGRAVTCEIQKAAAIGKKHRIPQAVLILDYVNRSTARRLHPLDRHSFVPRKHDNAAIAPGSPKGVGNVAHRLDRAAADGNFLQLAVGEEGDIAAIGRPEWLSGVLCIGHGLKPVLVHRPQPKLSFSLGLRRHDEEAAVGRDGETLKNGGSLRHGDSGEQSRLCSLTKVDERKRRKRESQGPCRSDPNPLTQATAARNW